jgi:thiol-disulfide isomerase/thioredoxin
LSEVEWIEDKDRLLTVLASSPDVVIDFTAPSWCIPCQRFAPHYEKAAGNSDAKFVAVDVDKAPWAMLDYGVQGVPTVMLYRDGKFEKNLQERTVIKLLTEIQS